MNSSPKVSISNLTPYTLTTNCSSNSAPSPSSKNSTGESENTSTDYDLFLETLLKKLHKIRYSGQKNCLYKITLELGNFDELVIPLLGNVPFVINNTGAVLQSIEIKTPSTASAVEPDETL